MESVAESLLLNQGLATAAAERTSDRPLRDHTLTVASNYAHDADYNDANRMDVRSCDSGRLYRVDIHA